MFADRILLLNEDDLTITPEDIAKIKGTDSIEGTDMDANDQSQDMEDDNTDPNLDNQDPNNSSDLDNSTEDEQSNPEDDTSSMDPTSNGDSNKITVKDDDNSKKVKLLDLYKDLINITEDQTKAVESLPFVNELEFLETISFIKTSLSEIREDLKYMIKYQYLNISYLTAKKIFINFKFTLIEITRLLKTIFIYCKNNENMALDEAIKKRRNIKSNSLQNAITFYQRNVGKRGIRQN